MVLVEDLVQLVTGLAEVLCGVGRKNVLSMSKTTRRHAFSVPTTPQSPGRRLPPTPTALVAAAGADEQQLRADDVQHAAVVRADPGVPLEPARASVSSGRRAAVRPRPQEPRTTIAATINARAGGALRRALVLLLLGVLRLQADVGHAGPLVVGVLGEGGGWVGDLRHPSSSDRSLRLPALPSSTARPSSSP